MVEQQLIDYIKKAKATGQPNNHTRALLRQNGWTDAEIDEAFSAASQQRPESRSESRLETRPEPEPEFQPQHQVSGQPEVSVQKFQQPQRPEPLYQSDLEEEQMHRGSGSHLVLKLLTVIILLAVIVAGGYVALFQGDFLQSIVNKVASFFSPSVSVVPSVTPDAGTESKTPLTQKLVTKNLAVVPSEYDATKISLAAFSASGDKVIYCVALKVNSAEISCFLNGQKFLDNPFAFKPYWVGMSPNGQRIVFLYYESAKKQSFVFENGVEGPRYDGAITFPAFSNDSKNFAFMVIANNGKNFVVVDDKAFNSYDKIFTVPEWSSDGKYIIYGARDSENIFWVADEINENQ